ncbi:Aclacinomycin methylesterase RdmC [bacterium HR41]|nr:alpha/beta fold hydrolase [Thermoleophilum sp.]GBD46214.1 Aclacinomycin methylesterase RdmC [bacterium HR41]
MPESFARIGSVELCYEDLGPADGEPLLLVMGLGLQLVHWEDGFCELLRERGFRVVRFDNRDAGRSSKITGGPRPNIARALVGDRRVAAYSLSDMARDAVGLLDHLGIERAHIVGASMGGMIGQLMAIEHPRRVASLCSIMSSAGRRTDLPRLRALGALLARPPRQRDRFVAHMERIFRVIGSPAYPTPRERLRELAAIAYDRGHSTAGTARQLVAILTAPSRVRRLRAVQVPTLVVHGGADPLVPPRAGRAVAVAVPGARYVEFAGMGHDLPRELWPEIVDHIAANARRATASAAA